MMNKKKILIISAGSALLVLLVAALTMSIILKRTVSYDGDYRAGVSAEATITRNEKGVPVIHAAGWDDAFFCLGYLHAQDRLVMIEYCRAVARGRLAELVGEDGFVMDRIARAIGFSRAGGELLGTLKQPYREHIEAYVRGINFLKNSKFREIIGMSDVAGDDWTPADVLSIFLLGEWGNAFSHNRELALLFPDELDRHPLRDMVPEEYLYWYAPREQKNVAGLLEMRKIISARVLPAPHGFAASVPAARSSDGTLRIAMNLDNPMQLFPLWYPVRFAVNDDTIDGFTSAGLPFLWNGTNGKIIFTGFHLSADTQDFCIEETRTVEGRQQYLYQGAWKDFTIVKESIQTGKGRRSVEEMEFRMTERGPVLSDALQGRMKTDAISVKFIEPDESYIVSLFELPLAGDLDEARRRVTGVNSAPRVHLLASKGLARKVYSGRIPQRAVAGTVFRSDVRPGWAATADISAYVRTDDGAVLVAGDAMTEDAPPEVAGAMFFKDTGRLGRIREMLDRKTGVDEKYLHDVLFDITSPHAKKILPLFLQLLEKMPITSARLCRIYFKDWDLGTSTDSVPTTIFHTLLVRMIRDTIADEFKGEHVQTLLEHHYLYIDHYAEMFAADKSPLFDDIATDDRNETRDILFDRAFLRSMRTMNMIEGPIMEQWKWGTLHKGKFRLPLVRSDSFLARRLYRSERVMAPGAHSTINLGSFSNTENFGADMVTSLSAIIGPGGALIAPLFGYSTNPLSEYFDMYVENRQFTPMEGVQAHLVRIEPLR
jgi:penicillin G amidase